MKTVRTSALSSAQLGLWLKYQMAPRSAAFIVDIVCRLRGELEPDRLRQAIQAVADASDALRTFFGTEDGEPVQHVRAQVQAPMEVHCHACGQDVIAAWAARPFDITSEVLFETLLVQESPECWAWRTRFSHLVMDGVSLFAYVDAVSRAYGQLESGSKPDLDFLGSYGEHVAADAAYRASPRWQKDRAYWEARHSTPAEPNFRPGRGAEAGLTIRKAEIAPLRYQQFLDACRQEGLPVARRTRLDRRLGGTAPAGAHRLPPGHRFAQPQQRASRHAGHVQRLPAVSHRPGRRGKIGDAGAARRCATAARFALPPVHGRPACRRQPGRRAGVRPCAVACSRASPRRTGLRVPALRRLTGL